MNKSRFIEQLNLYLDNELSESEVEEFLAALRADPEKRRVYNQYRQIHSACGCLRRSSHRPRKSWVHRFSAIGGIAAAFGLVAFGGVRLISTIVPPNLSVADEAHFEVDQMTLASIEENETVDGILNLARLDADGEDWRQGLILATDRDRDAFFQQAVFESNNSRSAAGSWESVFNTPSQRGDNAFGVVRASATSSSIYNPVYLRSGGDFDRNR